VLYHYQAVAFKNYVHLQPAELQNEKELLEAVASGDEQAFTTLFHHYSPHLYTYVLHLTEDVTIADDVVQDVFTKVWTNREKLAAINSFGAWLTTISKNTIVDGFRAAARRKKRLDDLKELRQQDPETADEWLNNKENLAWLDQAIARLTPMQQQVYRLARTEGKTRKEISSMLQISELTVKTHLANAMQAIRQDLKKYLVILAVICGFEA
jgi:RNA polymerase sigma-70 factor (ECF subfamily)